MELSSEISETREIDKSLNRAILFLVLCSVYLGLTVGYIFRIVYMRDWSRIDLGVCFSIMAVLGILRWSSRIKKVVRGLLVTSSATL